MSGFGVAQPQFKPNAGRTSGQIKGLYQNTDPHHHGAILTLILTLTLSQAHLRVSDDPVANRQADGVEARARQHLKVRLRNPDVAVVLQRRAHDARQVLAGRVLCSWGPMSELGWRPS